MPILLIIGIIVVAVVAWVITTYNFFVGSKARIKAAVQEIGNQIKRQADLIPNLEASAKGYMKHEKGIFTDLAEARKAISAAVKSGDVNKMASAGSQVAELIPRLQIAVEDNPEIKGAEVVKPLMEELRDTSDKIMYARRLLIDLSADYNVRLVSFPGNLVANMFGFKEMKGFETPESGEHLSVSDSEMKTPKVSL